MARTRTRLYGAALAALAAACAAPVYAESPREMFYRAYYLEHEDGDLAAAVEVYSQVAASADAELKTLAQGHREACQEELAGRDFARLMPPGTLVYLEVNRPGQQFHRLADMLGLVAGEFAQVSSPPDAATGKRVAISPVLIRELIGIGGFAVSLTGFDPVKKMPSGVAIFHPGDVDIIRGLIETALPSAAEPVESIEGYATYHVEGKAFVCLTARMVIVSPQRGHIADVVRRLKGLSDKSFVSNPAVTEALEARDGAAAFFCVNAKPIMPLIVGIGGLSPEFVIARSALDLDSLQWIAGRAGVDADALSMELTIGFDEGQHNLAYNLLRTRPIRRDTLTCVPAGAAGFFAAGLGIAETPSAPPAEGNANPEVIGLDIGREIFSNIVDFVVYGLPPEGDAASAQTPIPDVAAVIRVNDPAKSQALWTQLLGIAAMAAGAPSMDGTTESVEGADVRTYQFPEGIVIRFATVDDKIVVACTPYAMQRALAATRDGGQSILSDDAFGRSLGQIGEHTSKALLLHPGRCLAIAKRFMSENDWREAEPFVGLLRDTVASMVTDESEKRFHASMKVTGVPEIGGFLAELIQRHEKEGRTHHQLHAAMQSSQWDEALRAVDDALASHPDRLELHCARFEILAVGKNDRDAALRWAAEHIVQGSHNPQGLNNFAWGLLTDSKYGGQYSELALEIAERACEATDHGDWALLDTLAHAKFATGAIEDAIRVQKSAIERSPENRRDALNEALARYEAVKNEQDVPVNQ